jgi:hypothetical protein
MLFLSSRLSFVVLLGLLAFSGAAGSTSAEKKVPNQVQRKPKQASPKKAQTVDMLNRFLNQWHGAAAKADAQVYLGALDETAIYLGTDATERWSATAFAQFTQPYFSKGKGWTYTPVERHIYIGPSHDVAWFDEKLANEKYGDVRGSGVLVLRPSGWKIVQYNLAFPIPNSVTKQIVSIIASTKK